MDKFTDRAFFFEDGGTTADGGTKVTAIARDNEDITAVIGCMTHFST